jgi:hypothetical protein
MRILHDAVVEPDAGIITGNEIRERAVVVELSKQGVSVCCGRWPRGLRIFV